MTSEVSYSMAAIRDLDRIWTDVLSVSRDNTTAENCISDLMDRIEEKRLFPRSGSPLYYMDGFTGYYYVVFKAYIAFYRIDQNGICVDRILSRKSDYMRTLKFSQ